MVVFEAVEAGEACAAVVADVVSRAVHLGPAPLPLPPAAAAAALLLIDVPALEVGMPLELVQGFAPASCKLTF